LKEIDDLNFMGKIYYSAECDETWGEHESKKLFLCSEPEKSYFILVDYCFFIKRDFKPEEFKPQSDEIQEVKWVGKNEILKFLAERYQQKV
jgi:isopentenyldiphosphate isomerase